MNLKFAQQLLFIICLLFLAPLGVSADDVKLCVNTFDADSYRGDYVSLKVEIKGGRPPYEIKWYNNKNQLIPGSQFCKEKNTSSVSVYAEQTQDIKVTVKDADGNIATDALRLLVRDIDNHPSTFEDLAETAFPLLSQFNKLGKKSWNNSFISGSFAFSSNSIQSDLFTTGFNLVFTNRSDTQENHNTSISVSRTGSHESDGYAVVLDSAFISFADLNTTDRYLTGFYINNPLSAFKDKDKHTKPLFKKGDYAYVTVTNLSNGASVDYYLADFRSPNKKERFCINTWQWVDLRPLGAVNGDIKLKYYSSLSKSRLPHSFCVDDFNGKPYTTDLPQQLIDGNASFDISEIVAQSGLNKSSLYTIYNIEGGYTQDATFEIRDSKLYVSASQCNVRIIIKAHSDYGDNYLLLPVAVKSAPEPAVFDRNNKVDSTYSALGTSSFTCGTYSFASSRASRKGFAYVPEQISDNAYADSLLCPVSNTGPDRVNSYTVLIDNGYAYTMVPDTVVSGFYVTPTLSTYNAITKDNFNKDSLILTVLDPASGKKIEYPLADYRSDNNDDHYCLDTWQWVDLRPLGNVNTLRFYINGNELRRNNITPSCCITNFGGSHSVSQMPSEILYLDEDGIADLPIDRYFNFDDLGLSVIKYSVDDVIGLDKENCVSLSNNVLHCVGKHNDEFTVVLKALNKGRSVYVSVPVSIMTDRLESADNQNDSSNNKPRQIISSYPSDTLKSDTVPLTQRAIPTDIINKDDNAPGRPLDCAKPQPPTPVKNKVNKQQQGNIPVKKTPPVPITHKDEKSSKTPASSPGDNNLDNKGPATVDTTEQKAAKKEFNEQSLKHNDKLKPTNKTLEEPEDMRIIYILLFIVVLVIALMYVYLRRQRSRDDSDYALLQQKYSKIISQYDEVNSEVGSLKSNYDKQLSEKDAEIARLKKGALNSEDSDSKIDSLKSSFSEKLNEKDAEIARLNETLSKQGVSAAQSAALTTSLDAAIKEKDAALKAKDAEIAKLTAALSKKDNTKEEIETIKSELDARLKEKEAQVASLKSELSTIIKTKDDEILKLNQLLSQHTHTESELTSMKTALTEQIDARDAEIKHLNAVIAEHTMEEGFLETLKSEYNAQLQEKETEINRLKEVLSSYQENVNPEVWNTEQSLLQHETVVQLHRDVDGAHIASDTQWQDLYGVVSKFMPDFYNALMERSRVLSENEVRVCILTRIKFLPTEMAVLLNLSKQRITNIRAAVNLKLFSEKGTKTFETNIQNLGK